MIAKSMLDYSWIEDVKNYKFFNSKSNILFIFEGVLMYFDESVMTKLLHTIIKSLEIIIWPLRLNFAQKQLQIIQKT